MLAQASAPPRDVQKLSDMMRDGASPRSTRWAAPHPLAGILLKSAAVLTFSLMFGLVKHLGHTYPVGELVFARSFFAMVPIVLMVYARPERWQAIRTQRPWGHVLRASAGLIGMIFNFLTLTLLPLGDAMAISFLAPLILVGLAPFLLHEHVGRIRVSAAVIGFLGVMIVAAPHAAIVQGGDVSPWGVASGFVAAFCVAIAQILLRAMGLTEKPLATVFWFTLTTTIASAVALPFGFVMPGVVDFMLLVLCGLLGGVAQFLITESYRHADASLLAPFDYLALPISLVLGLAVFHEIPTAYSLTGGVVIMASGLFIALRERALWRRQGRVPVAAPEV